jgi:hypothetical protein
VNRIQIGQRKEESALNTCVRSGFRLAESGAFERSVHLKRMQPVQKVLLTALAMVLGSIAGWAMVR